MILHVQKTKSPFSSLSFNFTAHDVQVQVLHNVRHLLNKSFWKSILFFHPTFIKRDVPHKTAEQKRSRRSCLICTIKGFSCLCLCPICGRVTLGRVHRWDGDAKWKKKTHNKNHLRSKSIRRGKNSSDVRRKRRPISCFSLPSHVHQWAEFVQVSLTNGT